MSFKGDLYDYLKGAPAVAALVSDRVYPQTVPTAADLPWIAMTKVSSPSIRTLGGDCGVENPSFRLDVWAATSETADAVADAIRNALSGFTGMMGDSDVMSARLDDLSDSFDAPDDGTESVLFNVPVDFTFWVRRAVPTLK